jgi:hypothetical protein
MTKNISKRVLSAVLTIVMLITIVGISAIAAAGDAIMAINASADATAMATAISANETELTTAGVDLSIFKALSTATQSSVNTTLVGGRPYADLPAFSTALTNAVYGVTLTRLNPILEDMNYTATVNSAGSWTDKMLYKFNISHPMLKSDFIVKNRINVMKTSRVDNSSNKTGTVTVADIDTNWYQWVDTKATIDTKGLLTSTTPYSYTFTSTKLTAPSTTEYYDVKDYIQAKVSEDVSQIAMRITGLPAGFYQSSDGDGHNIGMYVIYDKTAMLSAFNNATTSNIESLLKNNGGVFNFDVTGYTNLNATNKTAINTALLSARPFADFAAINTAYTTAVASLVYTQRYEIAEDYTLTFASTVTKVDATTAALWTPTKTNSMYELDFNLSGAPQNYVASKRLYVRNNSNSTSTVLRSISFVDALSKGDNYVGSDFTGLDSCAWKDINSVFNPVDITRATVDASGFVKIGVSSNITNLLNANLTNTQFTSKAGGTNAPYVIISYDKDAIVKDLNSAPSTAAVKTILQTYGKMVGVSTNDLTNNIDAISSVVFNSDFSTLSEFQTLITNYILPSINNATNVTDFKTLVNQYHINIGLDYSKFDRLAMKDKIYSDLFYLKGAGFASYADIISAFNTLVAANISAPIRSVSIEDYAYGGGDATINANSNWCTNFLTKFNVNGEVNTTSEFLVAVKYYQKQAARAEAALANKAVNLYEISPVSWTDGGYTGVPTTNANVLATGVITDNTKPIINSETITCANGSFFGLDVSNYFITNGTFSKTAGSVFALRMGLPATVSSFFQDGTLLEGAPYLSFEYDVGGIVNAISNANVSTIQGLIERNGSIIGINVSAYKNLSQKADVNNAIIGKNFTTATEIETAVNTAISKMLYKETFSIGAADTTKWGHINTSGTNGVGAEPFFMSQTRQTFSFFTFNKSASMIDKKYTAYAQVGLMRADGGEDNISNGGPKGIARYALFSSSNDTQSVISYSNNATKSGDLVSADVTDIAKNSTGEFTVYARGPITNLTNAGSRLLAPTASGQFLTDVYYDKLAIANDIAQAGSINAVNTMLVTYHSVFGIPSDASGDYSTYAIALLGQNIQTTVQLQQLITTGARRVAITQVTSPNITATSIGGVITIQNLSTQPKNIKVLIAAYNQYNEILGVTAVDTSSTNGAVAGSSSSQYGYILSGVSSVYKIRSFIWNSLDGLSPYDIPRETLIQN